MKSNRIRVLVVDDEPLARAGLKHLLAEDPEVAVIGEASDGADAVRAITTLLPDLVLLDVQMPEMTGLDVVREVGAENMPAVIFVTAYDEFALHAFEVDAIDYLLKPFDDDRFAQALARAKRYLRSVDLAELRGRLGNLIGSHYQRLVVKSAGKTHFIRVPDIDWIEAADYYSKIHVGGRAHLIRETMSSIEEKLDPRKFFRVHRSAIVNLDRIVEMQPFVRGDYVLILQDGTRLKLTRSRRERLEEILDQTL